MSFGSEIILRHRSIASLAAPGNVAGVQPVRHVHSLGPGRIAVRPLMTGGHFFDLWPVRELPEQGMWAARYYDSYAPPLFVLHDVTVHSSAGILAIGDTVIAESLAHTRPSAHAYRALAKGVAIQPRAVQRVAGTHISVLCAGENDYRRIMLESLARLACVPDTYFAATESVLLPRGGQGQMDLLDLFDLLPSVSVREVGHDETLRVETLIYPLSVTGESAYHPCVADFYRRLSANVPRLPRALPRRFYIDCRGNGLRPLTNEPELMAALVKAGFEPVRLETLSVQDQIRLFRQADAIVAPHGGHLSNLGFCRPGCLVVELHMDAYVDWSFRHLAALMGLRYDCVLGRARRPWPELSVAFHGTSWNISVQHVVAAVAHCMSSELAVARAA